LKVQRGRPLTVLMKKLIPGWIEALQAMSPGEKRLLWIPQDIALVAFDEFDWAALLSPPITVVDQRIPEIGAAAGRRLLDLFGHSSDTGEIVGVVKPYLRIRASCGCSADGGQPSAMEEAHS